MDEGRSAQAPNLSSWASGCQITAELAGVNLMHGCVREWGRDMTLEAPAWSAGLLWPILERTLAVLATIDMGVLTITGQNCSPGLRYANSYLTSAPEIRRTLDAQPFCLPLRGGRAGGDGSVASGRTVIENGPLKSLLGPVPLRELPASGLSASRALRSQGREVRSSCCEQWGFRGRGEAGKMPAVPEGAFQAVVTTSIVPGRRTNDLAPRNSGRQPVSRFAAARSTLRCLLCAG